MSIYIKSYRKVNEDINRIRDDNLSGVISNEVSKLISSRVLTELDKLPGFVMIGDSTAGRMNKYFAATSITATGTTATVTFTAHGLNIGNRVVVQNADQSEYVGVFTITSRPDANTFTYEMSSEPSVSPATGSIIVLALEHVWENNWAFLSNALAGQKGLYLGNFAQGGSRTEHLDRQLDLALEPSNNLWGRDVDFVFISSGINDVINGVEYDVIINNLSKSIERIKNKNAIPVVLTLWPISNTYASWTTTIAAAARKVNAWIINNARTKNFICINTFDICSDKTNQYGNWKSGYSSDGLHPLKNACFQVAKNIKSVFWDYFITKDDRALTSIGPNDDLSGTAGTASGTGASGSVADGLTMESLGGGSQTAVGAKGLSLTGNGESQLITFTAAAANDRSNLKNTSSIHGSVTVGDKVFCRMRYRTETDISSINLRYLALNCVATIDGVTSSPYASGIGYDQYSAATLGEKFDMVWETPPITITDTVPTSLSFWMLQFFGGAGEITGDISDFNIYKY